MDKSPGAFRTISEVAEGLEIPAHVLRFWESRFPQIRPVKRAGGRRYYRPADVALLTGIKRLLHDEGMTIRGVQKILREQGVRHVAGLSGQDVPDEADDAEAALVAALAANFGTEVEEPAPQAEIETAQVVALESALRIRATDEAPAESGPAEVVVLFDAPLAEPAADSIAAPALDADLPQDDAPEADHWLDPELQDQTLVGAGQQEPVAYHADPEESLAAADAQKDDSPSLASSQSPDAPLLDRLRALPAGALAHNAKAHALRHRLQALQAQVEAPPPRPSL